MLNTAPDNAPQTRNPARSGLITGIVLSASGGVACAIPIIAGVDTMNGGYALICIGGMLLITGLITLAVFATRYANAAQIIRGAGVLVHWTYLPEAHQAATEKDYASKRNENRVLLLIVAGFILACTVLFSLVSLSDTGEINAPFVLIMLGALVLLAVVTVLSPHIARRQAQRATPEVIIARDGMILFGAQHTWDSLGSKLMNVEYVDIGSGAQLQLTIRYITRSSASMYSTYTVNVPVPAGQENEALKVVAQLSSAH